MTRLPNGPCIGGHWGEDWHVPLLHHDLRHLAGERLRARLGAHPGHLLRHAGQGEYFARLYGREK